jgi:hypothetical protein
MTLSNILCLRPILFFSFFFSKSGAWSSSHVIISSFHVIISIITCSSSTPWTSSCNINYPKHISMSHLEHRVSPNRFHQLSKTKLGLSAGRPYARSDAAAAPYACGSVARSRPRCPCASRRREGSGKGKGAKTGFQVIKAQDRKMRWEGLNGYRNKFSIPDVKHGKSFRSEILETLGDGLLYPS